VGVDAILKEAGAAKPSLYQHFGYSGRSASHWA